MANSVTDKFDRITFNANNTFSLLKDRLEITSGINVSSAKTYSKSDTYTPYTPYDRLADDKGNSLPVVTLTTLRSSYIDTAGNGKLLDWHYRPKDEFNPNTKAQTDQYKINLGFNFKILKGLNLTGGYQFLKETNTINADYGISSYFTRSTINQYSSIVDNMVVRPVTLGGILYRTEVSSISKTGRLQLNYNEVLAQDHEINAIAGYEGSDSRSRSTGLILYGYDPELLTNTNNAIDPQKYYPYYYEPFIARQIQTAPDLRELTNITQSYYANVSYT
ncbi:hypothetical protein FMM05_20850, partial [Flavobacterium zepuense]